MRFLKNHYPKRFIKFSIAGFANFLIDFSVLNILSFSTGVNKGFFAAIFSAVAFLIANINSYCLNKEWTFKSANKYSSYKPFLAISIFGVAINIFTVYILTAFASQTCFSDIIWLNISKLIATGFVAFFNYFGYKKYAFKS